MPAKRICGKAANHRIERRTTDNDDSFTVPHGNAVLLHHHHLPLHQLLHLLLHQLQYETELCWVEPPCPQACNCLSHYCYWEVRAAAL